jgi:hypothetical protein
VSTEKSNRSSLQAAVAELVAAAQAWSDSLAAHEAALVSGVGVHEACDRHETNKARLRAAVEDMRDR